MGTAESFRAVIAEGCPADQSGKTHGVTPAAVALHLNRAASYYGIGMRTYYFSASILLWLFDSIWMLIATFGVLMVLYT